MQALTAQKLKKLMNFRVHGYFDNFFTEHVEKSANEQKITGWQRDNFHEIKMGYTRHLRPMLIGEAIGFEENLKSFKTVLNHNQNNAIKGPQQMKKVDMLSVVTLEKWVVTKVQARIADLQPVKKYRKFRTLFHSKNKERDP